MKRKLQASWPYSSYLEITRMKPDIFILGFQKCGTTSLFNYLVGIDEIVPPAQKEVDVLTERGCTLSQFLYYFPSVKRGKRTINASHQLSFVPDGIINFKKYFPPPQKLLVIMRNPIDRAFSHYHYDKQLGLLKAPVTFEEYIDLEMKIISRINDLENIEEVYEKTALYSKYGMCLSKGIYYIYLKRFMDEGYGFHSVFLDDLKKDFNEEFGSILNYLDVDVDKEKWPSPGVYNPGKEKKETMAPHVRQKLQEFYQPFNEKLFQLIQNKADWK